MHRYFEINEGGHNIRCKLYFQDLKSIRHMVVFCHGFAGHKDNGAAEKLADRLLSKYKGCALVTFNWPVHGDDVKKKLSLAGCDAYLGLVLSHLKQKYQPESIYACATSFGGYLVLKYIFEHGNPFRKVVLRCPAVNMHDVLLGGILASGDLEKLRRGKDVPVGFDRKIPISLAFLEELQKEDIQQWDYLDWAEDILILHGTADTVVPFAAAAAFAEKNLIELIPVEKADHRFQHPGSMELAIRETLTFFDLQK